MYNRRSRMAADKKNSNTGRPTWRPHFGSRQSLKHHIYYDGLIPESMIESKGFPARGVSRRWLFSREKEGLIDWKEDLFSNSKSSYEIPQFVRYTRFEGRTSPPRDVWIASTSSVATYGNTYFSEAHSWGMWAIDDCTGQRQMQHVRHRVRRQTE